MQKHHKLLRANLTVVLYNATHLLGMICIISPTRRNPASLFPMMMVPMSRHLSTMGIRNGSSGLRSTPSIKSNVCHRNERRTGELCIPMRHWRSNLASVWSRKNVCANLHRLNFCSNISKSLKATKLMATKRCKTHTHQSPLCVLLPGCIAALFGQ